MNRSLASTLPFPVSPPDSYDSPHTKTHLLLQAHFSHAPLPIADYATDTKSVLDQALRILQVSQLVETGNIIVIDMLRDQKEYVSQKLLKEDTLPNL